MTNLVLNHFKLITKTPHCSFETKKLKEVIINFAKKNNFETTQDLAGNILCKKGNPKICFQSHYDMVCMGDAPKIELLIKDDWLSAQNSSLGADNGMGIAIMFYLMEKYNDLEFLFTNDEEVGLMGASSLELEISSNKLLNLDTEEEGHVYIGCAGGLSIYGELSLTKRKMQKDEVLYEITVDNLPGGHSGVDIDKDIPNAIKILAKELSLNNASLVSFNGGERSNSIAKKAQSLVVLKNEPIILNKNFTIKKINDKNLEVINESNDILHFINAFSQGVRSFNSILEIPNASINFSIIKNETNKLKVEFFARAMSEDALQTLKFETTHLLEGFNFKVNYGEDTLPWMPQMNDFSHEVLESLKSIYKEPKPKAIHAGIECGIIIQRQKKQVNACSIGPTIEFPHSIREKCYLPSVERIIKVIENLIQKQ